MKRRRICLILAAALALVSCLAAPAAAQASLSIADLVLVAKSMSGQVELTAEQIAVYDVTGDGRVNVADLVVIARIITGTSAPSPGPTERPNYDEVIYMQGGVNVTTGDLTQVGVLVSGMLGGASELDFIQEGAPLSPLLAGLVELQQLRSNPSAYPVMGPLASSLEGQVLTVLDQMTDSAADDGVLRVPEQPVKAFANMLFGPAKITDDVAWADGCWEASSNQAMYAPSVKLVQFARYRHTTLAFAIYDVTIQENAYGITPGTVRIGMQFEISTNPIRIRPLKLMRLAPDQLEEESSITAVFFPSTVRV